MKTEYKALLSQNITTQKGDKTITHEMPFYGWEDDFYYDI
jgi:hypothetical protein